MKLAIQEQVLPGRTVQERIQQAQALGFDGVEVLATGLDARLMELAEALNAAQMPVASVHLGRKDGYISPDLATREAAIGYMRQSIATATDLHAEHVVFVPHWGALPTPDLTPHRSAEELASDLLIWLLRTVSDLAYALGVTLYMQPRHRYDTQFINTLEQAAHYMDVLKDNPYVKLAPGLFDMALEEANVLEALRTHGKRIGYLYVCDSNGRLPGQGLLDFANVAEVLREIQYDGWLCLAPGVPVDTPEQRYALYDGLPDSVALLRMAFA